MEMLLNWWLREWKCNKIYSRRDVGNGTSVLFTDDGTFIDIHLVEVQWKTSKKNPEVLLSSSGFLFVGLGEGAGNVPLGYFRIFPVVYSSHVLSTPFLSIPRQFYAHTFKMNMNLHYTVLQRGLKATYILMSLLFKRALFLQSVPVHKV